MPNLLKSGGMWFDFSVLFFFFVILLLQYCCETAERIRKHFKLPVILITTQRQSCFSGFLPPKSVIKMCFKKQNVIAHTFGISVLSRKREHGCTYSTEDSVKIVVCN